MLDGMGARNVEHDGGFLRSLGLTRGKVERRFEQQLTSVFRDQTRPTCVASANKANCVQTWKMKDRRQGQPTS